MKKFFIILLSCVLLFTYISKPLYADAAVASKVASAAAKKAAKEVIKDAAVETAVDMALNEAFQIAAEAEAKFESDPGYKVICSTPVSGGDCSNPVQIKTDLTDSDKANLGQQSEIELDKLITNGKGFTGWQKFLDWFVPLWLVSAAFTALTYALDSDTRNLFNEAAYNALVALGIIKPVTDKTTVVDSDKIKDDDKDPITNEDIANEPFPAIFSMTATQSRYENLVLNIGSFADGAPTLKTDALSLKNTFSGTNNAYPSSFTLSVGGVSGGYVVDINSARVLAPESIYTGLEHMRIALNGESVSTVTPDSTGYLATSADISNLIIDKMKSVLWRMPYEVNGFLYTDILVYTVSGDVLQFQLKHTGINVPAETTYLNPTARYIRSMMFENRMMKTTVNTITPIYEQVLPPEYIEIENDLDLVGAGNYEEEGRLAVIPPVAIPYEQTSTGVQLTPKPSPEGDRLIFETPTGEEVPEEDVTVKDPVVTKDPQGVPQITPTPTEQNPNPEPVPLTPAETPTPNPGDGDGTTPPPGTTDPNEPYPPGESCEASLKFPKFVPLLDTVSEAFPFSLPWDIYRAFQALFENVGDERPNFEFVYRWNGEDETVKIELPEVFDEFKPFTDSMLLFVFDVLILYAMIRLARGVNN